MINASIEATTIAWVPSKGSLATAVSIFFSSLVSQPAQALQCAAETFEQASYVVCSVDPATSDLRLFWKTAEGKPYRTFSKLAETLQNQGRDLIFAVNAGMYLTDFSPLGLLIENGEALSPADTATIEGPPKRVPNFYKKPNGIFFLVEKTAGILPTDEFLKMRPPARFATQSGPMLVIENELHPALIPGSTDKTRRSGVGVCNNGQIRFAISDDSVNFYDFARLFRDHLSCTNALFLDGGRGVGLYLPEMGRNDFSWHGGYGPIFGLLE